MEEVISVPGWLVVVVVAGLLAWWARSAWMLGGVETQERSRWCGVCEKMAEWGAVGVYWQCKGCGVIMK